MRLSIARPADRRGIAFTSLVLLGFVLSGCRALVSPEAVNGPLPGDADGRVLRLEFDDGAPLALASVRSLSGELLGQADESGHLRLPAHSSSVVDLLVSPLEPAGLMPWLFADRMLPGPADTLTLRYPPWREQAGFFVPSDSSAEIGFAQASIRFSWSPIGSDGEPRHLSTDVRPNASGAFLIRAPDVAYALTLFRALLSPATLTFSPEDSFRVGTPPWRIVLPIAPVDIALVRSADLPDSSEFVGIDYTLQCTAFGGAGGFSGRLDALRINDTGLVRTWGFAGWQELTVYPPAVGAGPSRAWFPRTETLELPVSGVLAWPVGRYRLRVRLLDSGGLPRAGVRSALVRSDGESARANTDGEGWVVFHADAGTYLLTLDESNEGSAVETISVDRDLEIVRVYDPD